MDDKIRVIGPDDMDVIPPEEDTETIKGLVSKLDVKLLRSKTAVQEILNMPPMKALNFLDDQIMAVTVLLNEEVLRWLTVLGTSQDKKERAEAAVHINNCINAASKIAETKIKLIQAIGVDRIKEIQQADTSTPAPDTKPKLFKRDETVTEEEFKKRYGHLVPGDAPTPSA